MKAPLSEIWNKVKDVPKEAQKPIKGGRLTGMTDISPQWRYHKMTETFGAVGFGWWFTIDKQWIEEGAAGEKCAMTNISLYARLGDEISAAIPGTGGASFVAKEKSGLYTSDEAFKMSLTDALSVAMKVLGVGAVIYSGGNDYSKYTAPKPVNSTTVGAEEKGVISEKQEADIDSLMSEVKANKEGFCKFFKINALSELPSSRYDEAIKMLESKRNKGAA